MSPQAYHLHFCPYHPPFCSFLPTVAFVQLCHAFPYIFSCAFVKFIFAFLWHFLIDALRFRNTAGGGPPATSLDTADLIQLPVLTVFIHLFTQVIKARGQRECLHGGSHKYRQRRPSQEGSTRLTVMLLTISECNHNY